MEVTKYTLLDLETPKQQNKFPVHLVLDNIRSAFNVGSAFRTSDAANVEKIHLCGMCAYPPHNKLAKTALGSTENVAWQHYPTSLEAIQELKQQKVTICMVELTDRSVDFWEYDFPKPVAVVFGHEVNGISDDILPLADEYIHIPMHGKKTSLNVATAMGIVLYEILRQWKD